MLTTGGPKPAPETEVRLVRDRGSTAAVEPLSRMADRHPLLSGRTASSWFKGDVMFRHRSRRREANSLPLETCLWRDGLLHAKQTPFLVDHWLGSSETLSSRGFFKYLSETLPDITVLAVPEP